MKDRKSFFKVHWYIDLRPFITEMANYNILGFDKWTIYGYI